MPFKSVKQEIFMQINHPDIWKRWRSKYGDVKGYKSALHKRRKKRSYGKSKRH